MKNFNTKKRILVTGGTGFIGSSIVENLTKNYSTVFALGRELKSWSPKSVVENFVSFDLISDDITIFDKIDTIVNCCSLIDNEVGLKSWDSFYKANCLTVKRLVENLEFNQFIQLSTGSIFSVKNNEYIVNPKSYYGLSKYLSDQFLKINSNQLQKYQTVIFRLPIIVGKNSKRGIVYEFLQSAINNEDIEIFGDGQNFRNILHVSSFVNLVELAINNSSKLKNYNEFFVGSSNSIKIIDIAKSILQNLASTSRINCLNDKQFHNFDSFVDISKITSILSYNPPSSDESLHQYLCELK